MYADNNIEEARVREGALAEGLRPGSLTRRCAPAPAGRASGSRRRLGAGRQANRGANGGRVVFGRVVGQDRQGRARQMPRKLAGGEAASPASQASKMRLCSSAAIDSARGTPLM